MIGLISSVPDEGKVLINHLKKKTTVAGRPLYKGMIGLKDTVYIISGMGKTNAAHAATVLIERFSPDIIILFGVGGAYPSAGIEVGDVAVAEKEVYGDEGVQTRDGFQGTKVIGIPLLRKGRNKFYNEFPLDRTLLTKVSSTIPPSASITPVCPPLTKGGWGDFKVNLGAFVTVSTCTGTRERALELKKRFNAICENMEGAAVAHICALYGVPIIEIRGISNIVEDRDKAKWNIALAADNCQRVLQELLKASVT